MAEISRNAPLRAWFSFAANLIFSGRKRTKTYPIPHALSDRMARDIGLGRVELERLRHRWPSETTDRPLI